MSNLNADGLLPPEHLREVQIYMQGSLVYIPRGGGEKDYDGELVQARAKAWIDAIKQYVKQRPSDAGSMTWRRNTDFPQAAFGRYCTPAKAISDYPSGVMSDKIGMEAMPCPNSIEY